jgi:hypothetical protein
MENKLTLEDQFLNLEQSKELQELGVDIYGNFEIDIDDNGFETIEKVGTFASDTFEYYKKSIPTLSVAEMIEMLPMDIEAKSKKYGNQTVYLSIDRHSVMYFVSGQEFERGLYIYKSFEKPLLRDALFEAIRWLKQNKLI